MSRKAYFRQASCIGKGISQGSAHVPGRSRCRKLPLLVAERMYACGYMPMILMLCSGLLSNLKSSGGLVIRLTRYKLPDHLSMHWPARGGGAAVWQPTFYDESVCRWRLARLGGRPGGRRQAAGGRCVKLVPATRLHCEAIELSTVRYDSFGHQEGQLAVRDLCRSWCLEPVCDRGSGWCGAQTFQRLLPL